MTTIFDIPGTNAPNPFFEPINAFLDSTNPTSAPKPDETAGAVVSTITDFSDPAHALWQLWDAFFTAVVTSPTSNDRLLALLNSFRTQPPTQPSNVRAGSNAERQLRSYTEADGSLHWPKLPRFSAQWRDVHDILEQWRDWDGVRASGEDNSTTASTLSSSGDKHYLHFCTFSAVVLKATKGKGEVHPIRVFYACHDVLERTGPEDRQPKAHRMSSEEVWALDVRVAATWVREGGRELWNTDREELSREWAAALEEKTDLWPREDGLMRERWQLWEERLRTLSVEERFDGETRKVLAEAAEVVAGLLAET